MKRKNWGRFLFFAMCIFWLEFTVTAQNLQKYKSLIQQARAYGLSNDEILKQAEAQGYSTGQIKLLQDELETDQVQEEINQRERVEPNFYSPEKISEEKLAVFGLDYFKKSNIKSIFSDNSLPTPQDYIVAAGDELYIDIYGASEKYYTVTVNPDGNITLSNIGIVPVAGLTIPQIANRLKNRLSALYTGISGNNPTTFLNVSLGSVRTISVHVVGEVNNPGTYGVSALSNVLNVLHAANGLTEKASLRKVELFRNNKNIGNVDLYSFLLFGELPKNIRLESNDIIRLGNASSQVEICGRVNRPAIYEIMEGETLTDLIKYAGGFTPDAWKEKIFLERITNNDRQIAEIATDHFNIFTLRPGDRVTVQRIQNSFQNRIIIQGAVMRPGSYASSESSTLSSIIEKAGGLRPDAYIKRMLISRTKKDLSISSFAINFEDILNGAEEDILLLPEDKVLIISNNDRKNEYYVKVSGEVVIPGIYQYTEGMTLGQLLFLSRGIKENIQGSIIEVYRQDRNLTDIEPLKIRSIQVDSSNQLSSLDDTLSLRPFDQVMVRMNTLQYHPISVTLIGEVVRPGEYVLVSRNEKISQLIKRSGGLTSWADIKGASILRKTEYYREESEVEEKVADLTFLNKTLDSTSTQADQLLKAKIQEEISSQLQQLNDANENLASRSRRERIEDIRNKNPLLGSLEIKRTETIPLQLEQALRNSKSSSNLILEDGDIIVVPPMSQTVRLRGHVLYPNTIPFEKDKSARYFVNESGGFDSRALRRKTYVVYPNGNVARTRSYIVFNDYPAVQPGSEIIVPVKPPKIPVRPGELASLTTGLAAMGAVIVQILISL